MNLHFLLFSTIFIIYNEVGGSKIYKTTRFGDRYYDCVDFYKQPSFSHPKLRTHSFHHLMRPSFHTRSVEGSLLENKAELKRNCCPVGTVPIRRITKDTSKIESPVSVHEPSGTYRLVYIWCKLTRPVSNANYEQYAGVRTKSGSARYSGGGMSVSVYNPRTQPGAYSLARLKISSGPDAIQVGWRVDPLLRGDNLTRLYIYTETNSSHCFDAQCGFVIVNTTIPLDDHLAPVSQPGVRPKYVLELYIIRDPPTGNWWLMCGSSNNKVGFWPKDIFIGLRDLATSVEWAGEVSSSPGVFEPLMGSGYRPSVGTTNYVAYFEEITILNENNIYLDAENLEEFATDRSLYDVEDEGIAGVYKHLVLFGGSRY